MKDSEIKKILARISHKDLQWLAGLIDSDGHISISKRDHIKKPGVRRRVTLSINQSTWNRKLLEYAQGVLGGMGSIYYYYYRLSLRCWKKLKCSEQIFLIQLHLSEVYSLLLTFPQQNFLLHFCGQTYTA